MRSSIPTRLLLFTSLKLSTLQIFAKEIAHLGVIYDILNIGFNLNPHVLLQYKLDGFMV